MVICLNGDMAAVPINIISGLTVSDLPVVGLIV